MRVETTNNASALSRHHRSGTPLSVVEFTNFCVPSDTWGVVIDDSKIQRKLMLRLMGYAGVDARRRVVRGKDPEEVRNLKSILINILDSHPTSKVLVMMDEDLDYHRHHHQRRGGGRARRPDQQEPEKLSGSQAMKSILDGLQPNQQSRVCVLIRSANDSTTDVATFVQRSHGYIPKRSMKEQQVRQILEPLWVDRFSVENQHANADAEETTTMTMTEEDELDFFKEELLQSLDQVDRLLQTRTFDKVPWPHLWGALNALKGDLMVVDKSDALARAVSMIAGMRGSQAPPDFEARWDVTRNVIVNGVNAIVKTF